METVVIFNPGDSSIIFALAACLQTGYKIIPASSMAEIWDNGNRQIVLLDIYPNDPRYQDLDMYLKLQAPKIKFVIGLHDVYHKNANHDDGVLELLRHVTPQMLIDANNMKDFNRTNQDKIAVRYGQSLKAARVKATNDEDEYFYQQTIVDAAYEIFTKKKNYDIDTLVEAYKKMLNVTLAAKQKIETKDSPFSIPKREVAFGYLDHISPWLDLEKLKKDSLLLFPYLCVIQYKNNGEDYTWIGSDGLLNVRHFINLDGVGPSHQVLLRGSHKQTTQHIRQAIAEITK